MIQLAYKNSLVETKALHFDKNCCKSLRTFFPSIEEFQDPVTYIEQIA